MPRRKGPYTSKPEASDKVKVPSVQNNLPKPITGPNNVASLPKGGTQMNPKVPTLTRPNKLTPRTPRI